MTKFFRAYGRWVGYRPWTALGAVLVLTVVAVVGLGLTASDDSEQGAFLPDGSELVSALNELVARDQSGDVVGGIGIVTVNAHDDFEGLADAQISVDEAVKGLELAGLESARTLSPGKVSKESDLSNDRTIRNLLDFAAAIEDPLQKPEAVSSGITLSLGNYARSLPPEIRSQIESDLALSRPHPLAIDSSVIDDTLELMRSHDPSAFDAVVALDPVGDDDRTILQFSALTGDPDRTRDLFADVDGLWFGDDEDITPVASEITSLEITDSLIDSQTSAIALTIVAALIVLVLFFWVTEFRPMLAVLAVLPILLVLVWVLGTMVLLGFSYNVVTALITALSVGIGVDYTIHITHRFVEEREHHGKSIKDAISSTMHTTGGALIGSALTTALGFSVLVFSPIPPMGQFGLLTAITVVYSLIAAVVVLPPMLVTWAAYHQWRQAGTKTLAPA